MAVGCLYLAGLFTLHAGIVMEPYLQGVTSSNVWVMVECDLVMIRPWWLSMARRQSMGLGARSVYEVATNGKTYVHRVLLRGLKPSTRYHYQVSHDGEVTKDTSFFQRPSGNAIYVCVYLRFSVDGTSSGSSGGVVVKP